MYIFVYILSGRRIMNRIIYDIKSKIRHIINGIKNIFYWMPLIYEDKNFDYTFLYKIIYFKLKNMEEFWNSDKPCTLKQEDMAKQIMMCKNLAKRLYEDDYLTNASINHHQNYEERTMDELFQRNENGWYTYVSDSNKKRAKDFKKCCRHSDYMKEQDKELLFKYLNKYIHNWWD